MLKKQVELPSNFTLVSELKHLTELLYQQPQPRSSLLFGKLSKTTVIKRNVECTYGHSNTVVELVQARGKQLKWGTNFSSPFTVEFWIYNRLWILKLPVEFIVSLSDQIWGR